VGPRSGVDGRGDHGTVQHVASRCADYDFPFLLYCRPKNIRCHVMRFSHPGGLAPGIFLPFIKCVIFVVIRFIEPIIKVVEKLQLLFTSMYVCFADPSGRPG
jgi:hypothetical protein